MPIIVKDFTWTQTEQYVSIRVPLHSVPSSAVDLFTAEDYFKASFEAFFFECFPFENINTDESRATILSTDIFYELKKQSAGRWPQLEKTLTKAEKKDIKAKAIVAMQEKLTKEFNDKRNIYYQQKRDAVTMAIAQDTKKRNKIDQIKEEEKLKALGDINELQIDAKPTKSNKSKIENNHYTKVYEQTKQYQEVPAVPMPRVCKSVVEVEFTPRVLPTPSRESKTDEENEWLRKQMLARRSAGFVSDDLLPEEKNPDFILSKGKQFMRHKNYLGAISAFTFGIELSPNLVDFHIMRSKAHFAIGNLHKCVQDCSTAMDIMKPEVYANLSQRVECIHRRGMALFKLGLKRQAADELKAAINLQPSPELTRDLYEILDSPEYVEKEHETVGLQEISH